MRLPNAHVCFACGKVHDLMQHCRRLGVVGFAEAFVCLALCAHVSIPPAHAVRLTTVEVTIGDPKTKLTVVVAAAACMCAIEPFCKTTCALTIDVCASVMKA